MDCSTPVGKEGWNNFNRKTPLGVITNQLRFAENMAERQTFCYRLNLSNFKHMHTCQCDWLSSVACLISITCYLIVVTTEIIDLHYGHFFSTTVILMAICSGGGLVTKSCPTLAVPWTVSRQAPLSMGFSRKEHWSGLPFPSPGDLPNLGIKPWSPASQADS